MRNQTRGVSIVDWEPIPTLVKQVKTGEVTAKSLVERALGAIQQASQYNALITVTADSALKCADDIDSKIAQGSSVGKLAGVPFIAKDNFLTKGITTTAASNILRGYIPPYSATVINRLEAEGAILVGKSNLDAFAHGSSTENSDFGPTRNPYDTSRVPGGSSGGSAAAVALGLAPFALGSDTGGSIRLPASFCGIVGLKPTYGVVSRYGVVAMASSTDCMGPLTTTVKDAAYVLDCMAGLDVNDGTTIEPEPSYLIDNPKSIRGLRVGVLSEYMGEGLDQGVRSVITAAIEKLREHGVHIVDVSIPNVKAALAVYYIVVPAEVSSNLSRYDGIRYGLSVRESSDLAEIYRRTRNQGFNAENKRRIIMGTYVLSSGYYDAYYKKAQTVRTKLIHEYNRAFEQVDVIIGPTAPSTAFKLGENTNDPLQMYLTDIMTVAANLVGNPAINIPAGMYGRLPVGIQLQTPQRRDKDLLLIAAAFEEVLHAG